ncbi:hypothetical protein NE471_27850, partial [Escherichia coli]
ETPLEVVYSPTFSALPPAHYDMMLLGIAVTFRETPRVYVAFCFYICNLNAALAMLGKFLDFAGVLCNLHIK